MNQELEIKKEEYRVIDGKAYLTIAEAGKILGVTPKTLRAHIQKNGDNNIMLLEVNNREIMHLDAETMTKATKYYAGKGSGEGYANLSWYKNQLEESSHPVAYSALAKFKEFYSDQLRTQGNCINKDDFKSLLNTITTTATEDGAYFVDLASGIKFKADWNK